MADSAPHVDETIASARLDLVEDAPSVCHPIGAHAIHVVRLRLRARTVSFRVLPTGVERIIGFRAFVDPSESVVIVTSVIADMRERIRHPFDITRWTTTHGYASHALGLMSWLFPLEVSLERRSDGDPVVDIVVVTEVTPDAGTLP